VKESKTKLIRGGLVYTGAMALEMDLLIDGERVAALLDPQNEVTADEVIDASGLAVFPGLIDIHAHTRSPGYEYKEDFESASRAAAVGGFTTFVDMPNVEPPTTTLKLLEEKRSVADQTCIIDWGHFVGPTELDQIPKMAEAGATGFKLFQVRGGYPHDPRLAVDDPGKIHAIFREVAKTNLPLLVHPFAQSLFEAFSEEAFEAGQPRDIATFSEIYTKDIVWSLAVAVLLELARETGVRLHIVHTHAAGSLRQLRRAKADGVSVTASVDPKYYHMRHEDLEALGAKAIPGGYITSNATRMEAIWRALQDGTIDIIDSDHAPHTLEDLQVMENDPWTGPFGSPHYDHMLALTLTDARKGKLKLQRVVELMAVNPARLLGRYPEKGALLPGSSADMVFVDLDRESIPEDDQMQSKAKWTPYVGWQLVGYPVMTYLRGEKIAQEGQVLGEPGYGRYIEGRSVQT
jgi:dihydroorotase (multifunctional complex type)